MFSKLVNRFPTRSIFVFNLGLHEQTGAHEELHRRGLGTEPLRDCCHFSVF